MWYGGVKQTARPVHRLGCDGVSQKRSKQAQGIFCMLEKHADFIL